MVAAAAGDFTGDGADDVLVTTNYLTYVIYDKKGGIQAHIQINSSFNVSQILQINTRNYLPSIGYIGNINKDGINDMAFLAQGYLPRFPNSRSIFVVVYGRQSVNRPNINLTNPTEFDISKSDMITKTNFGLN